MLDVVLLFYHFCQFYTPVFCFPGVPAHKNNRLVVFFLVIQFKDSELLYKGTIFGAFMVHVCNHTKNYNNVVSVYSWNLDFSNDTAIITINFL